LKFNAVYSFSLYHPSSPFISSVFRCHSAKIIRSREPASRLNAVFLTKFRFHQFHEMAAEGGKSFARRDKLLEIESKVRVWWDEKDVFKAEPGEKPPQPGKQMCSRDVAS
ncbi:uncharacterized protein LOC120185317, partial [Hibiscus syriacus]|uniref:uncharacterized protein LOC120185317 n=1 Tax=Hibiscus syriacus TaxID=106335 RepID=UPI001924C01A